MRVGICWSIRIKKGPYRDEPYRSLFVVIKKLYSICIKSQLGVDNEQL